MQEAKLGLKSAESSTSDQHGSPVSPTFHCAGTRCIPNPRDDGVRFLPMDEHYCVAMLCQIWPSHNPCRVVVSSNQEIRGRSPISPAVFLEILCTYWLPPTDTSLFLLDGGSCHAIQIRSSESDSPAPMRR